MPRQIPPHRLTCSFCFPQRGEMLSVSKLGGDPACICDVCIEERMATVIAARQSPEVFAAALDAVEALQHRAWRVAHGLPAEAPL